MRLVLGQRVFLLFDRIEGHALESIDRFFLQLVIEQPLEGPLRHQMIDVGQQQPRGIGLVGGDVAGRVLVPANVHIDSKHPHRQADFPSLGLAIRRSVIDDNQLQLIPNAGWQALQAPQMLIEHPLIHVVRQAKGDLAADHEIRFHGKQSTI